MKQNLYQRAIFKRYNMLKYSILGLSFLLASYPRLLIEVFIRRDFGHRYFNLSSSITVFLILAWLPMMGSYDIDFETIYYAIIADPLWYGYLFAFLFFSFKRHKELRVKAGSYDHSWFSQSAGVSLEWFENIKFRGKHFTNRTIEIWLEPLAFFLAGLLLLLLQNILGILLVICAVIYSLSYRAAYAIGDGLIYDMIDTNIIGRSTVKFYEEGEETVEETGVQFYTNRIKNKELGRYISDAMQGKDDDFTDGTSYAF